MADSNWTEASQLTLDDILFNIQEKNTTISSLKSYSQNAIVYNLTVANNHTYFVGVGGVLGHNAGCEVPQWNGKFGKHLFYGDKTGGFHHRGMFYRSYNSRVVKILYTEKSGVWKGAFQAKVRIGSTKGKTKRSTFFPDTWTKSQVQKEVNEALFQAMNSGSYKNTGLFIGYSAAHRPIKFFLRKGKPITAYPDIGGF